MRKKKKKVKIVSDFQCEWCGHCLKCCQQDPCKKRFQDESHPIDKE